MDFVVEVGTIDLAFLFDTTFTITYGWDIRDNNDDMDSSMSITNAQPSLEDINTSDTIKEDVKRL